MKINNSIIKILLTVVVLISSLNCYSQNNFIKKNSFIFKRDSLNTNPLISIKFGINATNLFENHYTPDSLPSKTPSASLPESFFHFQYYPVFTYEATVSHKFYFINDRIVLETGLEFMKTVYALRRVNGSYTDKSLADVQKIKEVFYDLGTPILIGITNKETSISIGTTFFMFGGGNTKTITLTNTEINRDNPSIDFELFSYEINPFIQVSENIIKCKEINVDLYTALELRTPRYFHLGTQFNF